ncbi:hypothetical protein [Hymenobacter pini]|uniref:hypothetical protein n=1 Tax=Hymenobacter pini TaxID=2880879 RepID=UPI001CF222DE|nr:hypothetical protein [Hymenobacter pini]MCA8830312.1 hypothetical protein [Hymenobacter pini]
MNHKSETPVSKPERFVAPVVLKLNLGQLGAAAVPYLILASLCYVSGYWSNVGIDVFNYYQVQDVLKSLANPLLSFIGLTFYPLLTIASVLGTWQKKATPPTKLSWITFEDGEKWYERAIMHVLTALMVVAIVGLVLGLVVGFVALVSLLLFPVENLAPFTVTYLRTLDWLDLLRLPVLIFFGPWLAALLLRDYVRKSTTEFGSLIGSVVIPLILAYHFGRMESYKALSGLEFRYVETPKGALKYMGKVGDFYFFSEDGGYVPYRKREYDGLVNDQYVRTIRIVSSDSLKQLRLLHYTSARKASLPPDSFRKRL